MRLRLGLLSLALTAALALSACGSSGEISILLRQQPGPAESAQQFLQALSEGRYADMWAMMAPPARQEWPSASFFADYLDRKCGAFSLTYSLGEMKVQSEWRDASATIWPEAALVPVSLTLDGQALSDFQGLPLALAQGEGSWRILDAGPAARSAPLLLPPDPAAKTRVLPILAYHHVAQQEPTDFEQITMTVTTSQFEEELAYLKEAGYQTITLRQLFEALYYDVPLPAKPVVLSFDDGYADAYTEAFPLLQKYGFIGTFAVFTQAIGAQALGYLTAEQVQTMAAAGMEFVSHTVNHTDLGAATPEQAVAELRDPKAALEKLLGRPMQFLIYPYGEPFAHYGPEVQQAIVALMRQEGYVLGVTNPLPGEPPDINQEAEAPYQLSRVNVPGRLPLVRFIARLEGTDPG